MRAKYHENAYYEWVWPNIDGFLGSFGPHAAPSGGGRHIDASAAQLGVAAQVVGQVHQTDLDLRPRQAEGADFLSAQAVLLKSEQVLDPRTLLVALGLLVIQGLSSLALLVDVAEVGRPFEARLGRLAAIGTVRPHVGIFIVRVDDLVKDLTLMQVGRGDPVVAYQFMPGIDVEVISCRRSGSCRASSSNGRPSPLDHPGGLDFPAAEARQRSSSGPSSSVSRSSAVRVAILPASPHGDSIFQGAL